MTHWLPLPILIHVDAVMITQTAVLGWQAGNVRAEGKEQEVKSKQLPLGNHPGSL